MVFIDDAHEEFELLYSALPVNTFSHHFVKLAEALFDGIKDRKRKPGGKNVQACVLGIQHR